MIPLINLVCRLYPEMEKHGKALCLAFVAWEILTTRTDRMWHDADPAQQGAT